MRIRLVILVAVFALSLGVAPSVGATPLTRAAAIVPPNGVYTYSQTPIRSADGNTIYAVADTFAFVGGISGIPADTYTWTVHSNGLGTAQGIETCSSCTIGGRTGSYTAVFRFTSNADGTQYYTSQFTFTSAAGGLAGLRGEGTLPNPTTLVFSYHFEP